VSFAACCARAASGHIAAVPQKSVMNSRRFMRSSQAEDHTLPHCIENAVSCITAFWSTRFPQRVNSLHYRAAALLSASPQLAESIRAAKGFRVVPTPDLRTAAKAKCYSITSSANM
jgi:hypothetical protein